jgi:hypothetical protein
LKVRELVPSEYIYGFLSRMKNTLTVSASLR